MAPNKQITLNATLYAGPKVQSELKEVAVGLNQTVDYGLLWPISKILFAILDGIHKVIGNWGWSIILLTLLVKIALMWVSNKSYYSMAKMRAIAPRLAILKEEHGDDRMKMSQEMMAIYKEEKVNRIKLEIGDKKFDKIIAFGDTFGDKAMFKFANESHYRFFH